MTLPIWDEYLSFLTLFGPFPHLDQKPTNFAAKTCFLLIFIYFWNEKGCHHELPLPVPPFLAMPLVKGAFTYAGRETTQREAN